jgi:hypothetical protein
MTDISAMKNRPLDPRLNWAALSQAERDAAYDCYSAWGLALDRRPSRTPVHA